MRLIYTGYDLDVTICENQITVISIENPKAYTEVLHDIWIQSQGGDGGFLFSADGKIKSISKEIECIFNPFLLDCNDKKILTKLYQELREQANENLINESLALNSHIVTYIEHLFQFVPYSLDYNADYDIMNLLKLYGVKIDTFGTSLLERIVEYLTALSKICGVRNYVFVGLKQYLTVAELEQLYEFVFYEKINLIIIEGKYTSKISGEKCWLLDEDLCIIEI